MRRRVADGRRPEDPHHRWKLALLKAHGLARRDHGTGLQAARGGPPKRAFAGNSPRAYVENDLRRWSNLGTARRTLVYLGMAYLCRAELDLVSESDETPHPVDRLLDLYKSLSNDEFRARELALSGSRREKNLKPSSREHIIHSELTRGARDRGCTHDTAAVAYCALLRRRRLSPRSLSERRGNESRRPLKPSRREDATTAGHRHAAE